MNRFSGRLRSLVALAAVLCFAAPVLSAQSSPQVSAALAAGSYFPLDVGNQWVFRIDDRLGTALRYDTWRVDRTQDVNGKVYAVIGLYSDGRLYGESFFRADDQGKVYLLSGDGENLFLDERAAPAQTQGVLRIISRGGAAHSEVGDFADTLTYSNQVAGLILEIGTFGRGVGLLTSTQSLQTGSSGGLTDKRTLVEAMVGGSAIRFSAPTGAIRLSIDDLSPDLTNKKAANCALPCYFAACGLGGGQPDPPGTYKPCARARVGLENWPANASRAVQIRLISPRGAVLFDKSFTVAGNAGDASISTQIPLFVSADQAYSPGTYRLSAATDDGTMQSSVAVQIR